MIDFFIAPFADYAFMKRALAGAIVLALGSAPLGVFMALRRMTLVGDALAHALLPGIAIGFFIAGLSLWALTLGGLAAALVVGSLAALLVRTTQLKEDAAFTLLYLLSLGIGVTLVSLKSGSVDLMHLLFGNILAIDPETLNLLTGVSIFSLFIVAAFYRRLIIEGFDPDFLAIASQKCGGCKANVIFFGLLMLNLVAAFQALGALMALGLMILPALAARFWLQNIDKIMPFAILFAMFSAYAGLLLSYHWGLPSGPAIVLVAGSLTFLSALVGRVGSVRVYCAERG